MTADEGAKVEGGVKVEGLGQVMLPVEDLERATEFYRDTLGLPFLFDAPGMAFFDVGGVRLMLGLPETPELTPPGSILYYRVADVEGAHRVLEKGGVSFEEAPRVVHRTDEHELWMAFFRDTEGNLAALMGERPTS